MTIVHEANDTRITAKHCQSLADIKWDVWLVAPGPRPVNFSKNINLKIVPRFRRRIVRMILGNFYVLLEAIRIRAQIYHFHDPELIVSGVLLRLFGKIVVYDVHEDLPNQILEKYYIPKRIRRFVAFFARFVEDSLTRCLSGVITVTPGLVRRFQAIHPRVALVRNFPTTLEFKALQPRGAPVGRKLIYIGQIGRTRGVLEMLDCLYELNRKAPTQLVLGGRVVPSSLIGHLSSHIAWKHVDYRGELTRIQVIDALRDSDLALVILQPTESYKKSIPVKMFEYMAAGLPFIASDFEDWRELLQSPEYCRFVDPNDPKSWASVIEDILSSKVDYARSSRMAIEDVFFKFNWESEFSHVIELYEDILGAKS